MPLSLHARTSWSALALLPLTAWRPLPVPAAPARPAAQVVVGGTLIHTIRTA